MYNVLILLLSLFSTSSGTWLWPKTRECEVVALGDVVIIVWLAVFDVMILDIPIRRNALYAVLGEARIISKGGTQLTVRTYPDRTGCVIAYIQNFQSIHLRKFNKDLTEDVENSFVIYDVNHWSGKSRFDFFIHDDLSITIIFGGIDATNPRLDVYSSNGTLLSKKTLTNATSPVICGTPEGDFAIITMDDSILRIRHQLTTQGQDTIIGPYDVLLPWQNNPVAGLDEYRPTGSYSCAFSSVSVQVWYGVHNNRSNGILGSLFSLPGVYAEEQQILWFASEMPTGPLVPKGLFIEETTRFGLFYIRSVLVDNFEGICQSIGSRNTTSFVTAILTESCINQVSYLFPFGDFGWDVLPQNNNLSDVQYVSISIQGDSLYLDSSMDIKPVYPTRTLTATLPTGTETFSLSPTFTTTKSISLSKSKSFSHSITDSLDVVAVEPNPPATLPLTPIVIASVLCFIIVIGILYYAYRRRANHKAKLLFESEQGLMLLPMGQGGNGSIEERHFYTATFSSSAIATLISETGSSRDVTGRMVNVSPVQELRYTLIKTIGSGASGSVSLAVLEPSGTLMAVKQIKVSNTTATHIKREVELMTSLSHPHVITYLGQNHDNDSMVSSIFMEYIEGGTLHDISLHKYLSEQTVSGYIKQALHGVQYIHSQGVIHRDIKCTNMLLDKNGRVVLADFGCSKVDTNQSCSATFAGTPVFMPPEIILCADCPRYTTAVDIWSLGCSVVEVLNKGQPPWPVFETPWAAFYFMANTFKDRRPPPAVPTGLSDNCQEFLASTFIYDIDERATADTLLNSDFICQFEEIHTIS